MTQRTRTTPSPATDNGAKLTGNKAAKAVLDRTLEKIIATPLENMKLSELPTTKERLLMLADIIEAQALLSKGIGFNMSDWHSKTYDKYQDRGGHFCESAACIAGSAVMWEDGKPPYASGSGYSERAAEILGVTYDDSDQLFTPSGRSSVGYSATPIQAAAVIRNFAETGIVDWVSVMKNGDGE